MKKWTKRMAVVGTVGVVVAFDCAGLTILPEEFTTNYVAAGASADVPSRASSTPSPTTSSPATARSRRSPKAR
jgi:hypothetical protein